MIRLDHKLKKNAGNIWLRLIKMENEEKQNEEWRMRNVIWIKWTVFLIYFVLYLWETRENMQKLMILYFILRWSWSRGKVSHIERHGLWLWLHKPKMDRTKGLMGDSKIYMLNIHQSIFNIQYSQYHEPCTMNHE